MILASLTVSLGLMIDKMKRYLKIFFITLTSLLLLFVTASTILLWIVFTPERLTPIVSGQAEKHIPYRTEIEEVDLTFFSTFPRFGIRMINFAMLSPGTGAPTDTLLKADELVGVIDAVALWKNRDLIINKFILSNGSLNLFTDITGNSNYGLLIAEPGAVPEELSEDTGFGFVDLKNLELKNLNLSYTDLSSKLNTSVTSLAAKISGSYREDNLKGRLDLSNASISVEYDGEKYMDHALLKLNIPFELLLSRQLVQLKDAFVSVNDMAVKLSGSIENNTIHKNINTDIIFELNSWQVSDAIALIPASFLEGLGKIDASGIISSRGIIKGVISDTLVPLMDINLILSDGYIRYVDLPFPLSEMSGDIHIFSDMNNDTTSWINIRHFEASTPNSAFRTRGKVDHLYSDMHYDLITDANVLTDEFISFLPRDINLEVNGRINGQVKTDFTMSQATNMALDNMKLSGSALLSNFSMLYDSIYFETGHSQIDFALPNPSTSERNTKFAYAKIASDSMTAFKTGHFSTSMKNIHVFMEMSDLRDTTVIPDLFCTFNIGSFRAGMDTINIALDQPLGYFSVSPVPGMPEQYAARLAYSSYDVAAQIGQSFASIDELTLRTDIVNDNTREDFFLQWQVNGFLDLSNGNISLSAFSHPLEIPDIKMRFDPETFNIQEGTIVIDQSDFGLTGILDNVLSWSRGDSLLRGDFNLVSRNTDIARLMSLTSGFGTEDDPVNREEQVVIKNPSQSNDNNSFTGPYMVPHGIDILLRANIKQATMGADTASNILGNVRVNDGILLLDALTFTTPAADMQLTAMYRTPRKNHLYLGLDYHLLDVEISRLLQMIPDIDTLMPMLRSFEGTGEFHIAVETYLDSLYNIKKSTLRGASSIRGKDLVLMDGETFSEISRSLRFRNRDQNRVDSLSVEFTIFREEIDIYPFLMVMDRYRAVVGGRHNFDLSFDYHISLIESPLPIRLGIDINGDMEKLQYRLASPRYAELYRPVSRRVVENRQLELRRIIREALLQNVRE